MNSCKILMVMCVLQLHSLASDQIVCKEDDLLKDLWKRKPYYKKEMDDMYGGLTRRPSPRILFQKLRNCTVYHGNIVINENTFAEKHEQDVRYEDLRNLENLKIINGIVYINLGRYLDLKNLSFLSNLREIHTSVSDTPGFTLTDSYVETIGFSNMRLNVPLISIEHNIRLCYMERFDTIKINPSSRVKTNFNKDPEECVRQGKVCSDSCNPNKGCWGPRDRHCFECRHWMAGGDCVDSCESKPGFFTPTKGHVCDRCSTKCNHGCVGPKSTQCPGQNEYCLAHMFFDDVSGQCLECSPSCFGAGYSNHSKLIVRACSGRGNFTGPRGCSVRCGGATFLTVSSDGLLECLPCHAGCSTCRNASLSGCIQRYKNEFGMNENLFVLILGGILRLVLIITEWCLKRLILRCKKQWRSTMFLIVNLEDTWDSERSIIGLNNPYGVELWVKYDNHYFSHAVYRSEIQSQGEDWLRCWIPRMSAGRKTFEELRDVLRPLFTGNEIRMIRQELGKVSGKDVAIAFPRDEDEEEDKRYEPKSQYCDVDGDQHAWEKAQEVRKERNYAGGSRRILICSGCTTVLEISHIAPYDVLLLYHRESEDIVKRIDKHLNDNGFSCRMRDPKALVPQVEEVVNFRVMLACISEEYLKSFDCKYEIIWAHSLRRQTSIPKVLPLLLEDVDWPLTDMDRDLRRILPRKNVCRILEEDVSDWRGERVDKLMNKLRVIVPEVEFLVIYDDRYFSPVVDREEVQDQGRDGSRYIKCRIPGMSAGRRTFEELRDVLGPLFTGDEIRMIQQERGRVSGKDVARVSPRDGDQAPSSTPHCDVDGNHHSGEEVGRSQRLRIIHAGSGRVLVCRGRRTVLRIVHIAPCLLSSSSEEEEDARLI